MKERNEVWFLIGNSNIKGKEIDFKLNFNKKIYNKSAKKNKELKRVINRFINNLITIMKSLSNSNFELECNNERLFMITFSEIEDKRIIRLIINDEISKFFVDKDTLKKVLILNQTNNDLIEIANVFIKSIKNKTNKEIISDIKMLNISNPVKLFDLKIGLNEDNVFSIFDINKYIFNKPVSDKYIAEKIKNSEIPLILEDIFKKIEVIVIKYKEFFPKNDIGIIISSIYLTDNNGFNTNIAYKNDNVEFINELNVFINNEYIIEMINSINRQILKF